MQANIINAINVSSTYQLFLYGAHDTHLLGLYKLLALNNDFVQPEFASALILELRQSVANPVNYFIQVYLKNNRADEPIEPTLLKIEGMFQDFYYIYCQNYV